MVTRRAVLSGLMCLAATPAVARVDGSRQVAAKARARLDAVIDISHSSVVRDFSLTREKSHILGVIHKATEGGDWRDPAYARRRPQAETAGLLWGAYHFGTHQYPGAQQAALFLATAQPSSSTLLALDFELNELNPANSMTLRQAEDFVRAVRAATGRYPMIYTNAGWANGKPMGSTGHRLHSQVGPKSILVNCPLWLGDYRSQPEVPSAWQGKGWHFWQYAGDVEDGGPRGARVRGVWGVESCDRNLFRGDEKALSRFWRQEAVRPPTKRLAQRG